MRGCVWGSTIEIANTQLERIMENYTLMGLRPIEPRGLRVSRNGITVMYENGDSWRTLTPNNTCGVRCNVAYIDRNIIPLYVDECIKPCLTAMPYSAIHYYWGSEPEIENSKE